MRSIASALWLMFCLMGVLFITVQFVPIWFQSIRNTSASESGINFLAADRVAIRPGHLLWVLGMFLSCIGPQI